MSISRPWWRGVFAYLLRIRPRSRNLRGSLMHRLLGVRLFNPGLWIPSRMSTAKGAAIGAFLGFSPLFGLHIPISILLCCAFRANVAAAILATFVSNPFTIAGLAWTQVKLGQWMLTGLTSGAPHGMGLAQYVSVYGRFFLLGSLVFSILGGLLAYLLTFMIWEASRKPRVNRIGRF